MKLDKTIITESSGTAYEYREYFPQGGGTKKDVVCIIPGVGGRRYHFDDVATQLAIMSVCKVLAFDSFDLSGVAKGNISWP